MRLIQVDQVPSIWKSGREGKGKLNRRQLLTVSRSLSIGGTKCTYQAASLKQVNGT